MFKPIKTEINFDLIESSLVQGERGIAFRLLLEAKGVSHDSITTLERIATLMMRAHEFSSAYEIRARIALDHPDDLTAQFAKVEAQAFAAQDDNARFTAAAALDDLTGLSKLAALHLINASNLYHTLRRSEKVLPTALRAVAQQDEPILSRRNLAYIHLYRGETAKARAVLGDLAKIDALGGHHLIEFAQMSVRCGSPKLGVVFAERRLIADPGSIFLIVFVCKLLSQAGQKREAYRRLLPKLWDVIGPINRVEIILDSANILNAAGEGALEGKFLAEAAKVVPGDQRIVEALRLASFISARTQGATQSMRSSLLAHLRRLTANFSGDALEDRVLEKRQRDADGDQSGL